MTNYGIPICYGRFGCFDKLSNHSDPRRANYNIHRNTHIGDGYASSATFGTKLNERNDEATNKKITIRQNILTNEKSILTNVESILTTVEIIPTTVENTLTNVETIPTNGENILTTVEIISTNEEMLLTNEGILSTNEEIILINKGILLINEKVLSINEEIRKSKGKNSNTGRDNYNIHRNTDNEGRFGKLSDPGRANYNIHGNTYIGDSSLYARNDEHCNATDKEGRFGKLSDPSNHSSTGRDASASSATQK
jgi:hypothetical protein